MEVYNSEEEQVQAIKQWWKDNSVSLIAGIVIGVAVLAGYRYWTDYKHTQAQQASEIYSDILSSVKDKAKKAEILKTDYSATPYAALAGLIVAKDHVDKNNLEEAITQLKWVVDNSDSGIQHIAQLRLARLYLSQDNIEAADALVKGVKVEGFSAAYNEIRGDINLAKNLPVQAKENYRLALASLSPGDQRYPIIKMKLDDLAQANSLMAPNGNVSAEDKSK
ncbi:MAG: tetratricopeptide repeat protein [Gammaproteobacteria bacterium]|nr:tetratricopeptide repeat protein [Gammaproteobacteria bacterium]MCW8987062.1 tetratricopeptide repeat protein [Gammaproteobacteria bacterium]MCW9030707.1 tetratricopeptide repeat protein [Gammaproteobacteria bacterium]